jgi:hypothetical protein
METVKIGYSAMSNISFHGVVDTEIPVDEWHEMSAEEQDEVIAEVQNELVDLWVEDGA